MLCATACATLNDPRTLMSSILRNAANDSKPYGATCSGRAAVCKLIQAVVFRSQEERHTSPVVITPAHNTAPESRPNFSIPSLRATDTSFCR